MTTVFTTQMDKTEYLPLHRIVSIHSQSEARIFFYLLFGCRKWTGAWGIWHKQPNNRAAHTQSLMYLELKEKAIKDVYKNIKGS